MQKLGELRQTNGQTMSNSRMARLTDSIKTEGVKDPLVVTQHEGATYILDGNNRAIAAYKAGLNEVPVIEKQLPWSGFKSPGDLTFEP
ncbi:ParB/RepB/Spo0J family partition protein [Luteibacter sp. dw_328]|uniref:ParB/RepB/Spo0J family partition protein n=1 Tax=Luteibacter sp. dw_328 TaxID=2719796 RepID=UPI001BD58426|nr:ParB/RepB/Spo0J family partition protein [Luteibacter sp. dw_328]